MSVFPSYMVMVGMRKPVGRGAYWISRLKGELVVEGVVSELLATSLSSRFWSSLISSCMGENVGMSFFLDDADVLLESRWMRKSFLAFWPSRSKTLRAGFGPPPIRTFSCDPGSATGLGRMLDTASL